MGIKKIGYTYAPWKKNKKDTIKSEVTKKLFDDAETFELNRERVYSSVKVYSFPREGKADKGPRLDNLNSKLEVGQTLHFMLHDFMYEKKTKGESVFPDGLTCIEPFHMVEITVGPAAQEQAEQGYGLNITGIRPLDFSLHSYMNPLGLQMLTKNYDEVRDKVVDSVRTATGVCYTIRQVLEHNNIGYLAKLNNKSYLTPSLADGWFKITCDGDESVLPGVHEIDVSLSDLLRMTNAGSDRNFAMLIVELASAADCLYCWVSKNEYYVRNDKDKSEFRGVPLINTDALLDFVDINQESGEPYTTLNFPFEVPNMTGAQLTVNHEPERFDGTFVPPCGDFVLSSDAAVIERGYKLSVGCEANPGFMPIIFKSTGGAGVKRTVGRMNWDSFSRN